MSMAKSAPSCVSTSLNGKVSLSALLTARLSACRRPGYAQAKSQPSGMRNYGLTPRPEALGARFEICANGILAHILPTI